ncbi:hypothetical protein HNQ85_000012 [Anoxybacillus calidus]|uniref:Uncharacterized protein n=1 Tax=[Anoxybacillus] calidus TaxID=575178 RepID=A0A7W0BVA5_9BACL|nr:hypothetical protein [Anoxybacillus calidus]MBA2869754.1 hypothetical protein [Anoxybacillus calidus]
MSPQGRRLFDPERLVAELDNPKSGGERLALKENVLPTRHACMSTEEGYFPETAPAITRRMSAKMLIQAADTLRAERCLM